MHKDITLKEYFDSFPSRKAKGVEQDRICKEMKVCRTTLRHWTNGTRKISPTKVPLLERLTNYQVKRQKIRPDIAWGIIKKLKVSKITEKPRRGTHSSSLKNVRKSG